MTNFKITVRADPAVSTYGPLPLPTRVTTAAHLAPPPLAGLRNKATFLFLYLKFRAVSS